jgi:hypothetical protein
MLGPTSSTNPRRPAIPSLDAYLTNSRRSSPVFASSFLANRHRGHPLCRPIAATPTRPAPSLPIPTNFVALLPDLLPVYLTRSSAAATSLSPTASFPMSLHPAVDAPAAHRPVDPLSCMSTAPAFRCQGPPADHRSAASLPRPPAFRTCAIDGHRNPSRPHHHLIFPHCCDPSSPTPASLPELPLTLVPATSSPTICHQRPRPVARGREPSSLHRTIVGFAA